jgi:hypothetical protein
MKEEIKDGAAVFTLEEEDFEKDDLINSLYEFFDEVIDRACHFYKDHPYINRYVINLGGFGLDKTKVEKLFRDYLDNKIRKATSYREAAKTGLIAFVSGAAAVQLTFDPIKNDPISYLTPLATSFCITLIYIIADKRKARKLENIKYRIYIK